MSRIAPDGNDLAVWRLNDTGSLYVNSVNPGTYDLTGAGNLVDSGTGIYDTGLWIPGFPSTSNFPTGSTASRNLASGANTLEPPFPMSITAWINLRDYLNTGSSDNFMFFVSKAYFTNSWSSPFLTFGFQMDTAGDGTWFGNLTTGAGSRTALGTGNYYPIPKSTGWHLLAQTYDGVNMNMYLDGSFVRTSPTSGAIDYGSHGPWIIGAIPAVLSGATTKQEPCCLIQDVRIANIARPQSYFKAMHRAGVLNF